MPEKVNWENNYGSFVSYICSHLLGTRNPPVSVLAKILRKNTVTDTHSEKNKYYKLKQCPLAHLPTAECQQDCRGYPRAWDLFKVDKKNHHSLCAPITSS